MKSFVTRLAGLTALAMALMTWPVASQAQCINGALTAEFQSQGEHAGLWKYCMAFDFGTDGPLQEIVIDFWYFKVCAEGVGCSDHWTFDEVAGRAFGADGCEMKLSGSIDCKGDNLIGSPGPLLRFAVTPVDGCQPDYAGKGSLCFYTEFGPMGGGDTSGIPQGDNMAVYGIAGGNDCVGYFSGPRPSACVTPTLPHTWGSLKSRYR